jgi:hypothetical protein
LYRDSSVGEDLSQSTEILKTPIFIRDCPYSVPSVQRTQRNRATTDRRRINDGSAISNRIAHLNAKRHARSYMHGVLPLRIVVQAPHSERSDSASLAAA